MLPCHHSLQIPCGTPTTDAPQFVHEQTSLVQDHCSQRYCKCYSTTSNIGLVLIARQSRVLAELLLPHSLIHAEELVNRRSLMGIPMPLHGGLSLCIASHPHIACL